ncbi:hypothetical protein E2553_40285 [Paraburkholderia dipogonis]|uniref:Uncharacterized protein n=1 Tax=Paraburkholderia dipogonis TaxID=1211383 RepID=A0A4Y8MJK4_9BURK|nr:hypothetical protein [Paraburkholderia dipogonis]TFE37650.1 hypothetical protein E2553_40285 [Paraburkholderia dipogonis]
MHGKRDLVRTFKLRGYEIPAANARVFLHLAGILVVPLAWIGAAWLWSPESPHRHRLVLWALCWAFVWMVFFYVRNIAVREEVQQGLHDPLYGPHLMRMRQREFDQSKARKQLNVLYVIAFAVVAAIVGLQAIGIDPLPHLSKRPVMRMSLEHSGR